MIMVLSLSEELGVWLGFVHFDSARSQDSSTAQMRMSFALSSLSWSGVGACGVLVELIRKQT